MPTTQMGAEDLELLESSAASTRERLRDIDLQQKFDSAIKAQNHRASVPMHDYLADMNTKIHKLEASMSETLPDALKGYLL